MANEILSGADELGTRVFHFVGKMILYGGLAAAGVQVLLAVFE